LNTSQKLQHLIEHLGGPEGLNQVLKKFYLKMSQDILIGFFFESKNLEHIANQQTAFILKASHLQKIYTGLPPSQAHLELPPILPGHFDRRLKILEQTLQEHKVSDEDIRNWIDFEKSFREIVLSFSGY